MKNIFDEINSRIPKAPQPVVPPPDQPKDSIETVIRRWQAGENKDDAAKILKYLSPTINSAMNSYAAGDNGKLRVKAAALALDAMRTFDPARGVSPQTFAFHNLKRLSRISSDRASVIRIPEEQRMQYNQLTEAAARFEDDHGREPSTAELADLTGLTEKRIDTIMNNNAVFSESATINPETGDSGFGVRGMSDMDYLSYVYAGASPVDQKIIEWSSGMHGKPILGTGDIAKKLNITPAAVSQRKNKLFAQLSEMRTLI